MKKESFIARMSNRSLPNRKGRGSIYFPSFIKAISSSARNRCRGSIYFPSFIRRGKGWFFFLFLSLIFISCSHDTENVSPEQQARADSLALHVAVMPVMDCLPIFYADRTGLFSAEGLDIRLHDYAAQMDVDTALLNKRVHLAYADMARLLEMQGDSLSLRMVMRMDGRLSLVTAKMKRIRSLKHLGERLIALERLSATDQLSDEIMQQAGMEQTAIYRPQINDVKLRWEMLREQLVEGAILPEPYVTLARSMGHNVLYTPADSTAHTWAGMAIRRTLMDDTLRCSQLKSFFRAYDKAVGQLNSGDIDTEQLLDIWTDLYDLPRTVADSIALPRFPKAGPAREKDADAALRWLQQRERRIRKVQRDSLLLNPF